MATSRPNNHRHGRAILMASCLLLLGFSESVSPLFAGTEETYKSLKVFSSVIEEIEQNYVDPVEPDKLIQKAIQGMINGLDPHSAFLPPEDFEELQVDTKGEFGGIGIVISVKDNTLTVISAIDGTPAYKAGVKPEDKIIKVNGESTQNMQLWEAVKKMRGPKGSTVTLTLLKQGASEPVDVVLIRDVIPMESVKYVTLKNGYGYVWITNFRDNTTDDLKNSLADLENENKPLKGLIVDLRDNPGGLLNQAVDISDIFLSNGVIVSIKGRHESQQNIFKAQPDPMDKAYPIVVLINGGSASASEIVAGALQDNKRALILGTPSFGKGSVQTVKALKDGYGIKYTIARYYTPNGTSIQAQGIQPDILLQHALLNQGEEGGESQGVKEKDLVNHLKAEPPKKSLLQNVQKEMEKKALKKHGQLEPKTLLSDNQVDRALQILISHTIFEKMTVRHAHK
jgi:carboxyl-terminal processing protease